MTDYEHVKPKQQLNFIYHKQAQMGQKRGILNCNISGTVTMWSLLSWGTAKIERIRHAQHTCLNSFLISDTLGKITALMVMLILLTMVTRIGRLLDSSWSAEDFLQQFIFWIYAKIPPQTSKCVILPSKYTYTISNLKISSLISTENFNNVCKHQSFDQAIHSISNITCVCSWNDLWTHCISEESHISHSVN